MFERYTDRARRCVVLAQEEARLFCHGYIGTEHLLLGLLHEGEGVAAQALTRLDLDLDTLRSDVEAIVGVGSDVGKGHVPFTPRAKKALELSLREALQLGHNYIGTEHVLLGLVREDEGVAARVLNARTSLSAVRKAVIEILSGFQQGIENQGPVGKQIFASADLPCAEEEIPLFRTRINPHQDWGTWRSLKQEKIDNQWWLTMEFLFDNLPTETLKIEVEVKPNQNQ